MHRDIINAQQFSQYCSLVNRRRSPHLLHSWRRDAGVCPLVAAAFMTGFSVNCAMGCRECRAYRVPGVLPAGCERLFAAGVPFRSTSREFAWPARQSAFPSAKAATLEARENGIPGSTNGRRTGPADFRSIRKVIRTCSLRA